MESRKDQLQQQIIEALRANDKDLYSLLRSQWAHRFGVESLEELKNLDLTPENQKPTNEEIRKYLSLFFDELIQHEKNWNNLKLTKFK